MSMDGAHAQNNNPQEIADFLKTGIHDGQLSEYVAHVDNTINGSQMSHTNRVELSHAVGQILQQEGLLPRATVEFSKDNFDTLSNGDKNITPLDLDNVIQAGLESTSPIRGMLARSLRTNIDSIAMAHQDTYTRDGEDPSVAKEVEKGISVKDLNKWGDNISQNKFHTQMSAELLSNFGVTEKWNGLAGEDGLLSKGELEDAQIDTIKYDPSQRSSLNYMRENFGDIKSSRSGDSTFKMSLSDIHDWSAKHGIEMEGSPRMETRSLDSRLDSGDKVGSSIHLGLNAITAGIQEGNLTARVRQFDQTMMQNGLSPAELSDVNSGIQNQLASNHVIKRVMGQYAVENFEGLKGDNKYIHSSELDSVLLSADSNNHPTETMIVGLLKQNSNEIALAHNDVTNNDTDRAEQSRGISLKDATKYRDGEIEERQHKDMSANMIGFFGTEEDFIRLAGGINDISDEAFHKLQHGSMSEDEFNESFNISKDELEVAREDNVRFSEAERNTIHYMRENWSEIRSANDDDGRKMTLSDLIKHADNNGITMEMVHPADHELVAHHVEEHHTESGEAPLIANPGGKWQRAEQQQNGWQRNDQSPERMEGSVRQNQNHRRDRIVEHDGRVGSPNEITRVRLNEGDRIWNLAKQKYGTNDIEAIFEANGMRPAVAHTEQGQPVLIDPGYKAGDEIVLPKAEDLPELTRRYRQRADNLREQFSSRVGVPDKCVEIQLMYGDTLSELAEQKYGRKVPITALYEANQLPPKWVQGQDGRMTAKEPTYYAGRTYILPPVQDIEALARAYEQKHFRR